MAAVCLALAGCGSGGYPGAAVASLSSSSITIDAGQQFNITASNPNSLPLTWTLGGGNCSGSLCGSLSSQTNTAVTYTAAGVTAQTTVVLTATIAGTNSTKTVAITVNPAPAITGATPAGVVGRAYSATLTTSGGTGTVRLSLASGSLPAGLTFNASTGVISGTPTTAGTSSFVVQGVDASDVPYTVTAPRQITITTAPVALTVSGNPPAGTVGTPYNTTVQAAGGTSPYTFSVASGSLPPGLALSAGTGVLSGTPSVAGTFPLTVQARDAAGSTASAGLNIVISNGTGSGGTLTLTTGTLPNGTVNTPYSSTLGVSGGTAPYACALVSGTLPAGLALSANCAVTGTPTVAGTSTVTVRATDGANPANTVTGPVGITIAPSQLNAGGTLPTGTTGQPYTGNVPVTGGTGPYTCTLASGSLPAGLTLNANCTVTGTPTGPGTSTGTVTVTDGSNPPQTVTGPVTVTINPAGLAIANGTLPNGTVGTPYTATIGGSGGTAPYTCSLVSGQLPAGLTLAANCAVSGTPTVPGTSTPTIRLTDSSSPAASITGPVSVTINPAALAIANGSLPNGTVGTPYTATIGGSGGTAPYTCSLVSGQLPAGLTLATNCTVSGTPTVPGTSTPTIRLTDSSSPAASVTGPVSVTINPAALAIANNTLPNGTVGTPYTATIGGTGGTGPYTCSLVSGQFPAGLTLAANCTVSGTPTVPGTSVPTIRLTDSSSPTASVTGPVSVTINPASGTLVITSPPSATVNQPYTGTIGVTGGTGPYTCVVTAGTAPAGLAVGSNCQVTGTPTTPGSTQVTVQATDTSTPTRTQTQPVTLTVNPGTTTLTITSPPTATVNVPYTGTVGVTGGTAPYTCALAGGTLPAGLTLNANCTVTGTPTTAGSTVISVKGTDSASPANTTTGPATITVQAPAAFTFTGSLPNGVVNQPYTQTLQATGGTAPYTYAVTAGALPAGLTLATNGTISGTPTTPGASSFVVTATDSAGAPQTASLPLVLLITYATTPQDALLKGPYAFLFQGYDDALAGLLAYQTSTIGSFTADGVGGISAGELDSNHQYSNPTGNTVGTQNVLGTYTIGADRRGTLLLVTLNADGTVGGSATYAIALRAAVAPATNSAQGTLIRFDNDQLAGTKGSGTLLAQNPAAVAAGLAGRYAYGVSGDTPCLPSCTVGLAAGPVASVGQFAVTGGTVAGTADVTVASTNFANGTLTGTVATPDSNGRVQLSLNNSNLNGTFYPTDYAAYVVDANRVLLMSTDKHSAFVLQAGTAQLQQQTTFSNASLGAAFVGYENSPVNPGLAGRTLQDVLNLSTAVVIRGVGNGNGTCTTTNVDTGGTTGVVNALTGLGSNSALVNALLGTYQSLGNSNCTVAANGRGTLAYPNPSTLLSTTLALLGLGNNPPPARTVYLVNNNAGYYLETGYAGLGFLEAQTGSPFTLATLNGAYTYGTVPPNSTAATITSSGAFTADGAGNATTTLDKNVGVGTINILQLGITTNSTYNLTDAAAGRYSLNTPAVIYAISPTRFVLLDTSLLSTSPYLALLF